MGDDTDSFAARLVKARNKAGLTQPQLAAKAGLGDPGTISRYERGKSSNPSRETLRKLGAALGIDWRELVAPEPEHESRVDRTDADDLEPAPSDQVDRVIEDMDLDEDVAEDLRKSQWKGGKVSDATLRSYAVDLRGVKRGKLKEATSVTPVLPEGAPKLSKVPKRR